MYFNAVGQLRSMPASWTDISNEDTFQQASEGRSWFRIDDLIELSALLETLRSGVK